MYFMEKLSVTFRVMPRGPRVCVFSGFDQFRLGLTQFPAFVHHDWFAIVDAEPADLLGRLHHLRLLMKIWMNQHVITKIYFGLQLPSLSGSFGLGFFRKY